MHTDRIAVSVVLIPPKDILQLAIDINKTFPDTITGNYVLDPEACIPHITLLMGLIARKQLPDVYRGLDSIAKKFSALNLTLTGHTTTARPKGKVLSSLIIAKTLGLQELHESILVGMTSVFTYDGVQKEMFYSPPSVSEIPLFWVKGFAKDSVRENYKPHITLGLGELKDTIAPVEFTASKLALCH